MTAHSKELFQNTIALSISEDVNGVVVHVHKATSSSKTVWYQLNQLTARLSSAQHCVIRHFE